jgi:N-acyl amino acid synthase of PEP-CTERM/exosortase system
MSRISRLLSLKRVKAPAENMDAKLDEFPSEAPDAKLPLYDIYEDTFELLRVNTPELKEAACRLRYQVYCIETGFEKPADHPDGIETDAFDAHSVHTLLIHRKSGMLVGNVRLVLPKPGDEMKSFPIQTLITHDRLNDRELIKRSGEVSRFCVSKNFRKREGDGLYTGVFLHNHASPLSVFKKHDQRRVIPFTPLGLIRAVFEMGIENNVTWGFAVLEPTLIRLLKKLGIEFNIMGPPVNYHGKRVPLEMDPLHICQSVKMKHPEVWKVLTNNGAIVHKMEALIKKQ